MKGSQGRNSRQELEAGTEAEAKEGLLSGLLPMRLSASSLHSLTTRGWNCLQRAGPSHQLLIKEMLCRPVHKTIW